MIGFAQPLSRFTLTGLGLRFSSSRARPHVSDLTLEAAAQDPVPPGTEFGGHAATPDVENFELNVVFVQPQIPWNTGNAGRTCLGLNARLHLVGPLGFDISEKGIRRAGLDYWQYLDVTAYENWEEFARMLPSLGPAYWFTKHGSTSLLDVEFPRCEKMALVFGSETNGFEDIEGQIPPDAPRISLPMYTTAIRSFNLSTSAGIAAFEALKQQYRLRKQE
eukprot:tig00001095_g7046.t1